MKKNVFTVFIDPIVTIDAFLNLFILYIPVSPHSGIYRGKTPNFIKSVIKNRKYVKKMKKNKNFYPRISILGARCEIILG